MDCTKHSKCQSKTRFSRALRQVFFVLIFYFGLNFGGTFKSFAQENLSQKPTKSPVRIRSDVIDIKQKSRKIEFLKNVVVEKDDSSMVADKMLVIYELSESEEANFGSNSKNLNSSKSDSFKASDKNKEQENNSKIKKIDALGNVRIFSQDFVASGNHGHFDPNRNVFVLQENVLVNNGSSIASGDEFIYSLTTKKGEFIGKKLGEKLNKFEKTPGKINQKTKLKKEAEGSKADDRVMIIINEDIEKSKASPSR
jgi:lipopolysaccharide export system protein LptA